MLSEPEALFKLLPAYIRLRDAKSGEALRQLLAIVGNQVSTLKRDLQRMYDGFFIETCDEWLVPYIADLVGLEPDYIGDQDPARAMPRANFMGRRATANAIADRRRKGTLWVLEELARDHANWPARAIEFYRRLAVATHLDHVNLDRPATCDIRSARRLSDLDTPFDRFCHVVDVRRISHVESRGRFAIQNVALFVWRSRRYSVTSTPANAREDIGPHAYTFSALGNDTQLFQRPVPEVDRSSIASAENLPVPISRWAMESDPTADARSASTEPTLVGPAASFYIEVPDWPKRKAPITIAPEHIIPADLSNWGYEVPKNHIAVDPVLGRIAFPTSQIPRRGVRVWYGYGFAMNMGGGEYVRPPLDLGARYTHFRVWPGKPLGDAKSNFANITAAFTRWREQRDSSKAEPLTLLIELAQSGIYPGKFHLTLRAKETVAIVAAPATRPIIWLSDASAEASDAIVVNGDQGSRVILDGLLIAGRALHVSSIASEDAEPLEESATASRKDLCEVQIRHCTLVPGSMLNPNCEPRRPAEPSIVLDNTAACLSIDASIVGAIQILAESNSQPPSIVIANSIVDATTSERQAIGGSAGEVANASLKVLRSTIVGQVCVHIFTLAEDSIFSGTVLVARRQVGCFRFSYVSPDSRTPKRYMCQPEAALLTLDEQLSPLSAKMGNSDFFALRELRRHELLFRVVPRFVSLRYGTPAYLRLSGCAPDEIKRGAHDESEMGVYHDLFEPQRLAMLSDRLAEFVPAGTEAAVLFAT